MKANWEKVSYRFSTFVLSGGVCLVLLVGILVWATRDHGDSLESSEQAITQPNELAIVAVEGDAGGFGAKKADTKPNVISTDVPLEVPERTDESFADSRPVADQTVSQEVVADQISENLPEVAPGTLADEPNVVTRLRESILAGPRGTMPIDELLPLALKTRDPSRTEMRLALLLRKEETLRELKSRLQAVPDDTTYDLLMLIQSQLRWSEVVPDVLALLGNEDAPEPVRGRAATAAAVFQQEQAAPQIRSLLADAKEPQVRQWAAMALALLGDENSASLIEPMLRDSSVYVRLTGAMTLGSLGDDSGLITAMDLSRHEKFDVRCRAAEALLHIATPEALARVREMQETDDSPTVRSESAEYLGQAELAGLEKRAALDRLKVMLSPNNPYPPRWAFVYLAEHFAPEATGILRQLADSPGPLQHAASVALLEVNSGVTTIPHIRRSRQ